MPLKNQDEIQSDFILETQSQRPDLTDTNEGSILDTISGATATAVDEITKVVVDNFKKTFFGTAEDTDLEYLAIDHFGEQFARPGASKATGTVTFSRPNTDAGNVLIEAGTVVKTEQNAVGSSQRYETVLDVLMTGTSINASVRAIAAGTDGNVGADEVTIVETPISDQSITVNNVTSFTGGAPQMDDAEYLLYIKNLIKTLVGSTLGSIVAKAKTVPGVEIAVAIENMIAVIEWDFVNQEPIGEYFLIPRAILYIADSNGSASDALIIDVQNAIKEIRSFGVRIDVRAALTVVINWVASITLNPFGPNYATLQADPTMIINSMRKYIQDLPIGQNFVRADARNYILGLYGEDGTNDLTEFTISSPSGDVTIEAGQKAIVGTLEIE